MTEPSAEPIEPGPWRAILLGGAIVAACVAGFFACFERRTEEVELPPQREALRNPYLAAQRLLQSSGMRVQSYEHPSALPWPPANDATLILLAERSAWSDQRSRDVLRWVESGGHLIVVTFTLWDDPDRTPDPLLDPLGLRQFTRIGQDAYGELQAEQSSEEAPTSTDWNESDADSDEPDASADDSDAEIGSDPDAGESEAEGEAGDSGGLIDSLSALVSDPTPAEVPFPDRPTPLRVSFDPSFYWIDAEGRARWSISDASGMHLAQVEVGEGVITALTDANFLTNTEIGRLDHAELLYRLASNPNAFEGAAAIDAAGSLTESVWLVIGGSRPSLLWTIWQHAWRVVLGLALLLIAWVAATSQRLGPILPDPSIRRRSLMEHVEASGRFLWHRGGRAQLLEAERKALLDRVRERHPGWVRLATHELHERLGLGAGLPVEEVARALERRDEPTHEEFVATVRTLQRLTAAV